MRRSRLNFAIQFIILTVIYIPVATLLTVTFNSGLTSGGELIAIFLLVMVGYVGYIIHLMRGRLADMDVNPSWAYVAIIFGLFPMSAILGLGIAFVKGTDGENKYGLPPNKPQNY